MWMVIGSAHKKVQRNYGLKGKPMPLFLAKTKSIPKYEEKSHRLSRMTKAITFFINAQRMLVHYAFETKIVQWRMLPN